jgi:hypothetical protein
MQAGQTAALSSIRAARGWETTSPKGTREQNAEAEASGEAKGRMAVYSERYKKHLHLMN